MKIREIIQVIEQVAPRPLQESYDNAGVQVGNVENELTSAVICLDVTEAVVDEAIELGANLILSHHPLIFSGLKSLTGKNYIERSLIKAINHGICIYSAHTNLDNAADGVNFMIASKLGLRDLAILDPKSQSDQTVGSGVTGYLEEPMEELQFLKELKSLFGCGCIKHSAPRGKEISKVALCGGSASFLIPNAIATDADVYLTGEIKYHEYFGNDEKILLAELGHYESEQFTIQLLAEIITKKYPTFLYHYTKVNTNPINYL
ncbi:MAG: Nif3-like dinuclear metal center hexameric protein [Bacteroidales bacterium]